MLVIFGEFLLVIGYGVKKNILVDEDIVLIVYFRVSKSLNSCFQIEFVVEHPRVAGKLRLSRQICIFTQFPTHLP